MQGLNEVRLLGNLCADPDLRFTQAGKPVLNFRLATNERYKNAEGEWVERVDYHSCVLWGKRGEAISKFVSKGTPVFVSGGLRTSSWEDKEGQKRYKTEVNVNDIILLGSKSNSNSSEDDTSTSDSPAGDDAGGDDEIPF
jgi:single-strand DNA-binding protein